MNAMYTTKGWMEFSDLDEKTQKSTTEVERVGMKLNPKKCLTLRPNHTKSVKSW